VQAKMTFSGQFGWNLAGMCTGHLPGNIFRHHRGHVLSYVSFAAVNSIPFSVKCTEVDANVLASELKTCH